MKILAKGSYHLFQFRENNYLFNVSSNAVIKIDALAKNVLTLYFEGISFDTIRERLFPKYSMDVLSTVFEEIQLLIQCGFFKSSPVTSDSENKNYVEKLIRMSTNKIELSLSEACNLRCKYCYIDGNDSLNKGIMHKEIAKQSIDFAFRRAGKSREIYITFFGGEPLLNKRVLRYVIYYSQQLAVEQGKRVHYLLTTNATLLDDEIISYIKQYNFSLMISMDGQREIHDKMRPFSNGKGSFDVIAQNIRNLMQHRRSLTVRCTLTNQNLDRIGIVDYLENFGFSRIVISRCISSKSNQFKLYDIGPDENAVLREQDDYFLDRLLEQLKKGEKIRFNPWSSAIKTIHEKKSTKISCGVGHGCTTVGIDGKLYPCHRYVGMDNYVLGDVHVGINQKKFSDYLNSYLENKKKCETCWARNLCKEYCPWHLSNEDGTFQSPQDWYCEDILNWYEKGIWLYDMLKSHYPNYFYQIVGNNRDEINTLTTLKEGNK